MAQKSFRRILRAHARAVIRNSYIRAAAPDIAVPLYERFVALLEQETGREVPTGRFGADMQVSLLNDGPVTIFMDTKNKE